MKWRARELSNVIRKSIRDPLYRNSAFLALGRFTDAGIGFFFWTFAARLYSITDVGIATALISSLGLVINFSRLGFDTTVIRFMPTHDRSKVFNTSVMVTTTAACIISVIYLVLIDRISPEISIIREYSGFFILFAVVYAITITSGNALLAFRRADLQYGQTLIMASRLLLLFPLIVFGSLGIFFSVGFAYLAAAFYALVIIRKYVVLSPTIDKAFFRSTLHFSSINYLATLLQGIPNQVMPIFIVTLLTPKDAALYYIAFSIGNLVLVIPDAMSTSFFVEGSHGMDLRKGVIRNLLATYAILVPAIIVMILFGDTLLSLFGDEYVSAFDLLRVITLSSLFVTLYLIFIPLQNIRLRTGGIIVINFARCVLLIGLSLTFLKEFGVIGAGYAWGLTYVLLSVGIVLYSVKKGWIRRRDTE